MLTLKVEMIAGSEIEKSFTEAVELATKLNCYVDFNFNGVECTATPNGNPIKGVFAYHEAIKSKREHPFAIC
jgi:hypothetical protein